MQNLKVALIQTKQFWEDKTQNFTHFEKHLDSIKEDVDLVLLPEMFNTSFSMNIADLSESIDGNSVNWLRTQAKKMNTQIGATLIINEEGSHYNRFVIVSEDGIQASYDKRHLFRMAKENDYFTAGNERVVYSIKGWNILLQVCYDLRFPVFSRNKTIEGKKEYDLVVYLANWPEKRSYVWKNLLQARAIENQVYCIGVNRVGEDGNNISYTGDSMMVNPWGNIDLQMAENKESVKILTLDKSVLKDIERSFPAFKDAD